MLENDRPKNPKQFPYVRIESEIFELGFVLLLSKPKNKTFNFFCNVIVKILGKIAYYSTV